MARKIKYLPARQSISTTNKAMQRRNILAVGKRCEAFN